MTTIAPPCSASLPEGRDAAARPIARSHRIAARVRVHHERSSRTGGEVFVSKLWLTTAFPADPEGGLDDDGGWGSSAEPHPPSSCRSSPDLPQPFIPDAWVDGHIRVSDASSPRTAATASLLTGPSASTALS